MTGEERHVVLDLLDSGEARLLGLTAGLSGAQWRFRETPERWSIAGNIEHLVVFENFILGVLQDLLAKPAEPEKAAGVAAKEPLVMAIGHAREKKISARDAMVPQGRWSDMQAMMAEFARTRERVRAFAADVQGDLRSRFFAHRSLGDLDAYQWLLVLGQHRARHALQIEEVMAHADFPRAR
ncbi:MAG TPA: DinB family protein [Bryobacteraceae bacterium]|nr:DinB family protein [Bryobacteraceae bacterium]